MVSLGRRESGTPENVWTESGWRASLPALPIDDLRRLVLVAAHPDDETLGAGGLLARVTALGLPVSVVVLTSGEAAHSVSPTQTKERLAALRRIDVMDAVSALAPDAVLRLLELPDGALSAHITDAVRAITAEVVRPESGSADAGSAESGSADAGSTESGDAEPGTWIVAPWRADGHPDHRAAALAAAHVAASTHVRLFEYPIWAWQWTAPSAEAWSDANLRALDLTPFEREAKVKAMALHRSQVHELEEATGDTAVAPPDFRAHFTRSYETFIEVDTRTEGANVAPGGATAPAARHEAPRESLPAVVFDRVYATETDAWGFESRWYERRKRAISLAALPRERFTTALELGCSTGVFTAQLAERCDSIVAVDIADKALEVARTRLAGHPQVSFEKRLVPRDWPPGFFELIVLSEVAYLCSAADLGRFLEKCRASLTPDGVLLACHWRPPVVDHPVTADQVHARLARVAGLQRTVQHREKDFLLEVFEPRPAKSVAEREGLVL